MTKTRTAEGKTDKEAGGRPGQLPLLSARGRADLGCIITIELVSFSGNYYRMPSVSQPVFFSQHYKIPSSALAPYHAIDKILTFDLPYFIDPLLLYRSQVPEMRLAAQDYEKFFEEIAGYLFKAQDRSEADINWYSAQEKLIFPELAGVGLGYGTKSSNGSGMAKYHANIIISNAKDIINLGYKDPNMFGVVMLLSGGIGADRISDMTAIIIEDRLMEYTQRVASALGVPTMPFQNRAQTKTYYLPLNPAATSNKDVPVLFIAGDIIRHVPVAGNFNGVFNAIHANQSVRDSISSHIGAIFNKRSSADRRNAKAMLKKAMSTNPSVVGSIAEMLKQVSLLTPTAQISANSPAMLSLALASLSDEMKVNVSPGEGVEESIVRKTGEIASRKGISGFFFESNGKPKDPDASRMLFMIIMSYVTMHSFPDLSISPHVPTTGRTHFYSEISPGDHIVDVRSFSQKGFLSGYNSHQQRMAKDQSKTYHYVMLDKGQQGEASYNDVLSAMNTFISSQARFPVPYKFDM